MSDMNRNIAITVAVVIAIAAGWYYMYGSAMMTDATPAPPPATQQTPGQTTK